MLIGLGSQKMNSHGPSDNQVAKSRRQKICLSMIVKDEASVIARCLASVRPLIDYWIIVDTGSTDGTPDVVGKVLDHVPGELHQRPWVDFSHNRSEALDLARSHGDYILIIDTDDVLELPSDFRLPFLKADSYTVEIWNKSRHYWRPQIIRSSLPWRYEGVLHEFLSLGVDKNNPRVCAENRSQKRLPSAKIRMSEEGARGRLSAAEQFSRDAAVPKNAFTTGTDLFLRARYKFYLAQCYLDAGTRPLREWRHLISGLTTKAIPSEPAMQFAAEPYGSKQTVSLFGCRSDVCSLSMSVPPDIHKCP
jgi:glycosyltransferase involved in cell wall biosynthesis